MVTQNTVLRLKATAAAVPKSKVLKLRLVKKEDANYILPKWSVYYTLEKLKTMEMTLDLLLDRARNILATMGEPPKPSMGDDNEEFQRRLRTQFARYEEGVELRKARGEYNEEEEESIAQVSIRLNEGVRRRMEEEADKKEEDDRRRFIAKKKSLEEYIKTREKDYEKISNLLEKENDRVLNILESASEEEGKFLSKGEEENQDKLELRKDAYRLLTREELIALLEKETKE